MLAAHLEREGFLREPVGLAKLQVVDRDPEHVRVLFGRGLSIELQRSVPIVGHFRDGHGLTRRCVCVVAQGGERHRRLKHANERGVRGYLTVHVELRGLLHGVLLRVRSPPAHQKHPLVLVEHTEEELFLLEAKPVVDHQPDMTARVEVARFRAELRARVLHRV